MALILDGVGSISGLTTAISGTSLGNKIQPVTATVAASALTLQLNPTTIDFRSPTLGSGAVNTRAVAAAITVVAPSTATLGTTSAVASRLILLALDNAGTIELAIVNIAGGTNLDETTLISTTAISASSTSASVVYSTIARTSLPFRVVGYVDSTQTTAGTWATAPSTIQGTGGQALAAMSSIGYGQTWQNVTASRVASTTYYNTTGKPIVVSLHDNASGLTFTVGGVAMNRPSNNFWYSAIVPPGVTYIANGAFTNWSELR